MSVEPHSTVNMAALTTISSMTTATIAGVVVPKTDIVQVSNEGCLRHSLGRGCGKIVSHTPGLKLTPEVYRECWRRMSQVHSLRGVPGATTRLAMLTNDADVALSLDGSAA
jgi:hypothetical protein